MKTEKLTTADCFKYPSAKIKGKECFENYESFSIKSTIEWYRGNKTMDISDYKLVLRSIDDITEEECKHINLIDTKNAGIELIVPYTPELTFFYFQQGDQLIFDYLRSRNILIEPEDWFESGKAVKE